MKILHLSDLHVREESIADQRIILKAMLHDIEAQRPADRFDLVVFTGDLTHSGQSEEFELAWDEFLVPVAAAAGVEPTSILVVPGNHDIDRSRINHWAEDGYHKSLSDRDAVNALIASDADLAEATRRVEPFRNLMSSRFGVTPTLGYTSVRTIAGATVGVMCLNSAWRATGSENDADKRKLIVGDRELRARLDEVAHCDVVIAALHHPTPWLASFDEDGTRFLLEQRCSLVLTGHVHRADPSEIGSHRGSIVYSACGCLYDGFDYLNAYSVVDLSLDVAVAVSVRSWWRDRECFDQATNLCDAGRLEFPATWVTTSDAPPPTAVAPLISVGFNAAMRPIVEVAQATSVIEAFRNRADLDKVGALLVSPIFLKSPWEREVALATAEGRRSLNRFDASGALAESGRLTVFGAHESGVTSALLWLLEQHHGADAERLPIYLDFTEITAGSDPLERAVRKKLRLLGLELRSTDPRPPCVIALDNVREDTKAADRVIQHVLAHGEDHYIFGLRPEQANVWTSATEAIDMRRTHLGRFGRAEAKQLVRKISPSASREVADQILSITVSENLPRTPFVMAALSAVVVSDGATLPPATETLVIDAYVGLLLDRDQVWPMGGRGLDFRSREAILSFLAEAFIRRGVTRMTALDTDQVLADYFRTLDWNDSPGKVLEALIKRRVLREDQEFIEFRYLSFLYFFAAKRMRDEKKFSDYIRESPLKFRAVIRHSAGLERNDWDLLQQTGALAVEAAANTLGLVPEGAFNEYSLLPPDAESKTETETDSLLEQVKLVPRDEHEARRDRDLDRFWEIATEQTDDDGEPSSGIDETMTALILASNVLKFSELVEDPNLKLDVLRQCLVRWGRVATVFLAIEQEEHYSRATIEQLIQASGKTLDQPQIEQDALLLTVLQGITRAVELLGTAKLANAVATLLDEEEFCGDPAASLIAAIIGQQIRCVRWAESMVKILDRHSNNPLIDRLLRTILIAEYNYSELNAEQERRIESAVAASFARVSPKKAGPQFERLVISQLRDARLLNKMQEHGSEKRILTIDAEEGEIEDAHENTAPVPPAIPADPS